MHYNEYRGKLLKNYYVIKTMVIWVPEDMNNSVHHVMFVIMMFIYRIWILSWRSNTFEMANVKSKEAIWLGYNPIILQNELSRKFSKTS